ncbi:plasmid partitioning protein RepB [Jiella avicenniae]|uniref:Plasmid partitioning protein RepB n=1 Tax=Jiella avicenniae TaxID=2907202 RepID=A0A9X1P3Z3_9HYPH|nr:plasmid partitioning protein RepB [Jiella avicenniae]MCE7030572.1 plasmid partitioning protein RepB [Jiella avicenniae]
MVKRKDALRALLSATPGNPAGQSEADRAPRTPGEEPAGQSESRDEPPSPPLPAASGEAAPAREHARSGAINAMRSSWGELQKEAEAARRLREDVRAGGHVVSIDPQKILPSPVVDRLSRAGDLDPGFDALKASIAADGQSVPVLLRPHSDPAKAAGGFFETAYGHRRVRAAKDLGLHVRAIVRPLSDDELVLAQGRENAERRDLTFVERAFFAKGLEARGFSRETMRAALGIDNTELTRLLQVAHRIPVAIAEAVGPAPKAGRPRWGELGEKIERQCGREVAMDFIQRDAFRALTDSDARFRALYKRMDRGTRRGESAGETKITTGDGMVLALAKSGPRSRPVLSFQTGEAFADFVAARLPELYRDFQREAEDRRGSDDASDGPGDDASG